MAGVLAVGIAWLQVPRAPALDGERWFKTMLCTLARGEVERAGGDADRFEAVVRAEVPYHPAARLVERKISNPAASVPGVALEGEQALVERLSAISDPQERLRFLFEEDPAAIGARTSDPFELGPAYDPALHLGEPASWDTLAAWREGDDAFGVAVRRGVDARWVLLEGPPEHASGWLAAMAAVLGASATLIGWQPWGAEPLAQRLRELAPRPEDRLVLVAEGAAVPPLLTALVEHATLRDQVLAVLSVAGAIGGRADEPEGPLSTQAREDWMAANFDQAALDTEVVRLTPYLAVQRLARAAWPPGLPGLPLQAQRFPVPGQGDAVVETIEAVDLGPLWADAERAGPPERVARALVAVVASWVTSRGNG
ncbi:MAG: hypothetical protein H6735_12460 [Alphaproteobacteria bacterium]|nr:hypothetical protein [Alphaproteobacteria bacterium]